LADSERVIRMERHVRQNEWEELEREIKETDVEIDELVYRLYELTEEERAIVEERSR